jgi:hypothetical protein
MASATDRPLRELNDVAMLRPPSHSPTDVRYAPGLRLARALGWFSIGLGAVELIAPRAIQRVSGVKSSPLLRVYGMREIATGAGILGSKQPAGWMWARVFGDVLDLATLAVPLFGRSPRRRRQALGATLAVTGVTLADVMCATQLSVAAAAEGSGYRRVPAANSAATSPAPLAQEATAPNLPRHPNQGSRP